MKGIVLAGGTGSRLYPMTRACCKQLLPIYDKPMLYYPLSVLMLAGIREILIITTPKDMPLMQGLLGDGSALGIHLEYCIQEKPNGIAEAFLLAEFFIGDSPVCLILGDNIFYGQIFSAMVQKAALREKGATVFGYPVNNPRAYGVVEFDKDGRVISIEEKPKNPKSNFAIPGLYFLDREVVGIAKKLRPSQRGELEIVDVIKTYMAAGNLHVELLGRGMAWLDTGTASDLLKASCFVETIQSRTGLYVACLEEIAYKMGFIDSVALFSLARELKNQEYREYLEDLAREENACRYLSIQEYLSGQNISA